MPGFFRALVGGGLFAGVGYLATDLATDIVTFSLLRDQAVELANQDPELCELIGQPFNTGPWYNSSIGFTHKGHIAHSSFQLIGSKRATDVQLRAVRKKGHAMTLLYNLLGPAEWRLMTCSAMVAAGGGLSRPKSLLPVPALDAEASEAAAQAHAQAHAQKKATQ